MNDRKYAVVIGVLLTALFFIFIIERAQGKISYTASLENVPYRIGEWEGKNVAVSEDTYEILETRDVLVREYTDKEGDSLVLAIVYSGNNRDSFHPPEYCYLGSGAQLMGKEKDTLLLDKDTAFHMNKLVMNSAKDGISVWYWYSVGDRFISNYYAQQILFLWDALRGVNKGGALIRISTVGNNQQQLERKAKSFIRQTLPSLRNLFVTS
jgi:EpsI family protein